MGKYIVDLNKTNSQLDVIDIYRLIHAETPEHTFFSKLHGTSTKKNCILDHKAYLNKLKNNIKYVFRL